MPSMMVPSINVHKSQLKLLPRLWEFASLVVILFCVWVDWWLNIFGVENYIAKLGMFFSQTKNQSGGWNRVSFWMACVLQGLGPIDRFLVIKVVDLDSSFGLMLEASKRCYPQAQLSSAVKILTSRKQLPIHNAACSFCCWQSWYSSIWAAWQSKSVQSIPNHYPRICSCKSI